MDRRYKMGEENPSIKDVFGLFSSARDPDTGELALAPLDVRRNTGNFIVAGEPYPFRILFPVTKLTEERL